MNRPQLVEYYEKMAGEIVRNSKNREVAGAFWDGTYDQRPNIVQYSSDVVQMARKGITSFHLSVEHWSNPMAITSESYEKLRTGWDMIIDIDSKIKSEINPDMAVEKSKMIALVICDFLGKYGIKNYGIKFSGRRGFHICLPWIMFPKEIDYTPLEKLYPKVPRIIAEFIREKTAFQANNELAKDNTFRTDEAKSLIELLGEDRKEPKPYHFVEVEKDWGKRHMFRAPFSFNEKTWLVSVPISYSGLKNFNRKNAEWDKVLYGNHPEFFKGEKEEAAGLLLDAIDWHAQNKKEQKQKPDIKKIPKIENKITEEHFPPCVKLMLEGLADGKKRSLFTLINFLRMMNWTQREIESKIMEWNTKNKPPLPQSVVLSQLRYMERKELVPPSNCDSNAYYIDIGMCRPDAICKGGTDKITIKNPIRYPFRVMKRTVKKKDPNKKFMRGFSCGVCNKEFKTLKALALHKGRSH